MTLLGRVGAAEAVATDGDGRMAQAVLRLDDLILARLVPERGAPVTEVRREVQSLLQSLLPADAIVGAFEAALDRLTSRDVVREIRGRLTLSSEGRRRLSQAYGLPVASERQTWTEVRDGWLVPAALGIKSPTDALRRSLAKPDVLAAVTLAKAYHLDIKGAVSAAKVRARLAVIALERAFGGKLKGGPGLGEGLSAKAARLLAAQLLSEPRDFGSDRTLMLALAADLLGLKRAEADDVRRMLIGRSLIATRMEAPRVRPALAPAAQPAAAPSAVPATPEPKRLPAAAHRPDFAGFIDAVKAAARTCAEGWPGNRKAFLNRTFGALTAAHPEWELSVFEFKALASEAHRKGLLKLVGADLKSPDRKTDFDASALAFKNAVLHLIRIEEAA